MRKYERLIQHLAEATQKDGNIIELGVYTGTSLSVILNHESTKCKVVYGVDSFAGLDKPSPINDKGRNNTMEHKPGMYKSNHRIIENKYGGYTNFKLIHGHIPDVLEGLKDEMFCFAHVDLTLYEATKAGLNYLWGRMSYGGTIFFSNFLPSVNGMEHKAIKEFIDDKGDKILCSRQMVVNGLRETVLAIKCYNDQNKPAGYVEEDNTDDVIFACVLKTGGIYDYKYVNRLAGGIKKHAGGNYKVYCLTDDIGREFTNIDKVVPLKHNFPRWWSKIELFRNDIFEGKRVIFLDLDTVIVGDLRELTYYNGNFMGLRDFYKLFGLGSGVLLWKDNPSNHRIYNEFIADSNSIMKNNHGDQDFIEKIITVREFVQDFVPSSVISYKVHCLQNSIDRNPKIPDNSSIICFHGNPRPHEINNDVSRIWLSYDK